MWTDLRLALRLIRRYPGYAIVVVLTLGLGIGGVSAVFTLADPMIFRPLPFADARRVVDVRARVKASETQRLHLDDYVAIAAQTKTLDIVSTLAGLYVGPFRNQADVILGVGVDEHFLRLTGLSPVVGRLFRTEEFQGPPAQKPTVALITWPFWQTAFGGRTDIVGQRLEVGGPQPLSLDIAGVLPREFFYPSAVNEAPKFVVPRPLEIRYLGQPNIYPQILAHVRPGFTFAQAEAELDPILAGVEQANPKFEQGRRARLMPLQDVLFGRMRTPLLLLFTATGCLLLVAWVNLAHLAQARTRSRAKDVAVSLALGASRGRIMRPMVIEAGLLSIAGSIAGVGIGSLFFSWGMARTPTFGHIYRLLPSDLDARVVVLTIALAVVGLVALGVWPAWRASRADLRSVLATVPGGARRAWRIGGESLTIAGQTAFAVGLVVTCLLVVRSFVALVSTDRGFDPAGMRLAGVQMPPGDPPVTAERYLRLMDELNRVPGVIAAVANGVPAFTIPEAPVDATGAPIRSTLVYNVSGRMADVLGARLEEGRVFTDAEAFGGTPLAVVDRFAANLLWPGQAALGQVVRMRDGRACLVVGVIGRLRRDFYDPATSDGSAFVTIDTKAAAVVNRLSVVVRFDPRHPPIDADLAEAARRADPSLTWGSTATMSSWERLLGEPRFLASALGMLAAITALLAVFGILGVVSHYVSRRTREIGIRLALGAGRRRVRALVIRQALTPALAGVTAGLVLAFWWSSSVRAVLVGVGPHDPWAFTAAAILTLLVVWAAALRPAIRASRIEPARTLRAD